MTGLPQGAKVNLRDKSISSPVTGTICSRWRLITSVCQAGIWHSAPGTSVGSVWWGNGSNCPQLVRENGTNSFYPAVKGVLPSGPINLVLKTATNSGQRKIRASGGCCRPTKLYHVGTCCHIWAFEGKFKVFLGAVCQSVRGGG